MLQFFYCVVNVSITNINFRRDVKYRNNTGASIKKVNVTYSFHQINLYTN